MCHYDYLFCLDLAQNLFTNQQPKPQQQHFIYLHVKPEVIHFHVHSAQGKRMTPLQFQSQDQVLSERM